MSRDASTTEAGERAASQPPGAAIEPLLTASDLAAIAQVSVRTVRRWHDLGEIPPGLRIGAVVRWRRSEIEAFLSGAWKPTRAGGRK